MIYTKLTKMAMRLCFEKHKNQVDKCGIPYLFHPFHVAEAMTDETSTCVALLHDVLEDTDTTADELRRAGFPEEVVKAVVIMTHNEGMSYFEYIGKIKKNDIARRVKLSDLAHNMDMTRLDTVGQRDIQRREKYTTAMEMLLDEDAPVKD